MKDGENSAASKIPSNLPGGMSPVALLVSVLPLVYQGLQAVLIDFYLDCADK